MGYDWMDLPKERGDETELELALRELITWAIDKGSSKEGNPYCKPEIKRALKALRPVVYVNTVDFLESAMDALDLESAMDALDDALDAANAKKGVRQ